MKKAISFCIALLLLWALPSLSSSTQITFERTCGDTNYDEGYSVAQTSDGGYIIAGRTDYFVTDYCDVYLIKTDSLGDTLWTKTYGGTDYDEGYSVAQTSDGGYIIAGGTYSYGAGGWDVYLIRSDPLGDTLWTKTYGGGFFDEGYSVAQTSDGGYIIAGVINFYGADISDVYLIKMDSLGDTLWTKTYGGTGYQEGYSVAQTSDGGYIIVGLTYSYGANGYDVYLIKTDSVGDTLWTKTYGGADYDKGESVAQTSDRGYIIAGWTYSYGAGYTDVYLIKTDSLGDTLWTKTYGGTGYDEGHSVAQTSDGGYIIAGRTDSFGAGYYDVYFIKTDSLGDTLWTRTYGGTEDDHGQSVAQTSDGGYIIAGWTDSFGAGSYDVYLIKTDSLGEVMSSSPALISPPDSAMYLPFKTVQLDWEDVPGASLYWLQVDVDSNFSDPIIDQSGIGSSNYELNDLDEWTTYWWRVAALSLSRVSPWSKAWQFKTIGVKPWTVMVYLDADELNIDADGLADLNEMELAGSSDSVNIIVLFDRDGEDDTHLYYVTRDSTDEIASTIIDNQASAWLQAEATMSDPQTLTDFGVWTIKNFPAEHYLLVIYDHGFGINIGGKSGSSGEPYYGECFDCHPAESFDYKWVIDLVELKNCLKEMYTVNDSQKINIVGHDVCDYGYIETYYEMAPYANIGIASQDIVCRKAWDYASALDSLRKNPGMNSEELAKTIIECTYQFNNAFDPDNPRSTCYQHNTQAAVDLDYLQNRLSPVLNNFAQALKDSVGYYLTEVDSAREKSKWFRKETYLNQPVIWGRDLGHFAKLISQNDSLPLAMRESAEALLDSLPNTFIWERHGEPDSLAHGLTIWFPTWWSEEAWPFGLYQRFDFSSESWDEFLREYCGGMHGPGDSLALFYYIHTINDSPPGGNNNGKPDPGETVELTVTLMNVGMSTAQDVFATLSVSEDSLVEVISDTSSYPPIEGIGETGASLSSYIFEVAGSCPVGHKIPFVLDIVGAGGYTNSDTFFVCVGIPPLLLVDDDGGEKYERYFATALDSSGYTYAIWDVSRFGSPPLSELELYDGLIWTTADDYSSSRSPATLTLIDQENLSSYLNKGGKLFLSSQDLLFDIDPPTSFITDYLHIAEHTDDTHPTEVTGIEGDPISKGMVFELNYPFENWGDDITPGNGATPIFVNTGYDQKSFTERGGQPSKPSANYGALKYENGTYKVVFFAFPFEAIPTQADRTTLLSSILGWLDISVGTPDNEHPVPIPKSFSLYQNYPNPFNPTTTIRYTIPAISDQQSAVSLKIYNILGQEVRIIVNKKQVPGYYSVSWDGRDSKGKEVSSGIYLYRLDAGDYKDVRKMLLIK